jgi:hypothetical protein
MRLSEFSRNGDTMKIQLGRELTERFERYAGVTNQTVADAIRIALADWMDTIGEGDIEVITGVPMDAEAQCVPMLATEQPLPMRLVN